MSSRNSRDRVPPNVLVGAQPDHQDGCDRRRGQTLGRLCPRDASGSADPSAATHISPQRPAIPHRHVRQRQAWTAHGR